MRCCFIIDEKRDYPRTDERRAGEEWIALAVEAGAIDDMGLDLEPAWGSP